MQTLIYETNPTIKYLDFTLLVPFKILLNYLKFVKVSLYVIYYLIDWCIITVEEVIFLNCQYFAYILNLVVHLLLIVLLMYAILSQNFFLNCNTISVFKLHITRFLTLTGQL